MFNEKLTKYFLLCSATNTRKHLFTDIPPEKLNVIIGKKDAMLFLTSIDGMLVAKEHIIGGSRVKKITII